MANPIGSKYNDEATQAYLKKRFGKPLPTMFGSQPKDYVSTAQPAAMPTASIPSASVKLPSLAPGYPEYLERNLTPVVPPAPRPEMTQGTMALKPGSLPASQKGAYLGGVKQVPDAGTYPQALESWKSQQRQTARQVELGDVPGFQTPEGGVVSQAFSNVAGTPRIDMGGFAPTNEAMRGMVKESKPMKFADYEAILANMKNLDEKTRREAAKTVAFKPGERAPLSMNQNQKAQYEAKQRQAEQALSRASALELAREATKGQIGEAEAKKDQALGIAEQANAVRQQGQQTAETKNQIAILKGLLQSAETEEEKKVYSAQLAKLGGVEIPSKGKLPENLIEEYKKRAGGDPKKAAELAKADGYSVV